MGFGYSMMNGKEGADLSPYIQVEKIDPKWLKAIGYKGAAKEVSKKRARMDSVATDGSTVVDVKF